MRIKFPRVTAIWALALILTAVTVFTFRDNDFGTTMILVSLSCLLWMIGWRLLKKEVYNGTATQKPTQEPVQNSKRDLPPKTGLNYEVFIVKGVNPATKRKRSITIFCHRDRTVEDIAQEKGLVPPFEIEEEAHSLPTDNQLSYAKDLGFSFPNNVTMKDVSCLISRAEDSDSEPNAGLIEFADGRQMLFSDYIGKKSLYNLIFNTLDTVDKIAFFCFSIYRYLSDDRHANLDTSPKKQIFYDFASQKAGDERFTKSMEKYAGQDLRFFGSMTIVEDGGTMEVTGGSTKTVCYQECAAFLNQKFRTPLIKNKRLKKSNLS